MERGKSTNKGESAFVSNLHLLYWTQTQDLHVLFSTAKQLNSANGLKTQKSAN